MIKRILSIFSEAKIYAYEPLYDHATELKIRFKDIKVFSLALCNYLGSATFFRHIMSETSSLIPTNRKSRWNVV